MITLTPRNDGGGHKDGAALTSKTDQDSNGGGGGDTSNFCLNNKKIENGANNGGFFANDAAQRPEPLVAPPAPESRATPGTQETFSAGCPSTTAVGHNLTPDAAQPPSIAAAKFSAPALVPIGLVQRMADDAELASRRERQGSRRKRRAKF